MAFKGRIQMNTGQSQLLSLLQSLVSAAGSAQAFATVNMAGTFAAHPCPVLQSDCQALLDAINNSVPIQNALAQLQADIVRLPAYAQIT